MLSHLRILPYFETFLFILRTFSVLPNVTAPLVAEMGFEPHDLRVIFPRVFRRGRQPNTG